MQKGKVYSKRCNGAPLSSRIFSVRKGSNFLFVSSLKAINVKIAASDIVRIAQEVATLNKCKLVIHAGWSFGEKCKANRQILENMRNAVKRPPIKTYVAELGGHYYIAESQNGATKIRKCTSQCFGYTSESIKGAKSIIDKLKSIGRMKTGKGLLPCFLLICGENNMFNPKNTAKKYSIDSVPNAELFLNQLRRIEDKEWIIFNPSHKVYPGKRIQQGIKSYHTRASRYDPVRCVITGNNPSNPLKVKPLNRALKWQNGNPKELKLLKEGQESNIFIHLGKI